MNVSGLVKTLEELVKEFFFENLNDVLDSEPFLYK